MYYQHLHGNISSQRVEEWSILSKICVTHIWRAAGVNTNRPVPSRFLSLSVPSRPVPPYFHLSHPVPSRSGTGQDGTGLIPRPAELWSLPIVSRTVSMDSSILSYSILPAMLCCFSQYAGSNLSTFRTLRWRGEFLWFTLHPNWLLSEPRRNPEHCCPILTLILKSATCSSHRIETHIQRRGYFLLHRNQDAKTGVPAKSLAHLKRTEAPPSSVARLRRLKR